jgi:hypothetical protein
MLRFFLVENSAAKIENPGFLADFMELKNLPK